MSLDIFGAITGLFAVVYDGQHALRFTLGRARAVVGPGIHFKLPLIQAFRIEDTKHTTLDLEPQVIQLRDDLVYEVDCKVVYQIVNLRKAKIEIDDLVIGLQNRVVMAVQQVVSRQDRRSVTDVDRLCEAVRAELRPIEDQWGVRVLQFGFSNISPSPTTLEITQLELLAAEKLRLFRVLRAEGLSEESSVALISGAVVSLQGERGLETQRRESRRDDLLIEAYEQELEDEERPGDEPPASTPPGSPEPDEET
jgi:regulator of protease activity HflC (stomatin/prohibitin superfamily)